MPYLWGLESEDKGLLRGLLLASNWRNMPHSWGFFFFQKSIKVILSVKMVTVLVTKIHFPLYGIEGQK
jgi:hypothetical protein